MWTDAFCAPFFVRLCSSAATTSTACWAQTLQSPFCADRGASLRLRISKFELWIRWLAALKTTSATTISAFCRYFPVSLAGISFHPLTQTMQVEALCAVMTGCKHRTPKPPPDPVYCSVGMSILRFAIVRFVYHACRKRMLGLQDVCLWHRDTGVRNLVLQDLVREVNKTNIKQMLALLPSINYMEVRLE